MGWSHMIEQVYWPNSSYWPILNLYAIFVRNFPALDILHHENCLKVAADAKYRLFDTNEWDYIDNADQLQIYKRAARLPFGEI